MTSEQTTTTPVLILKNAAGDYFLLPQEDLERSRVPEEYKIEVERLVADEEDVSGHDQGSAATRLARDGFADIAAGLIKVGMANVSAGTAEGIKLGTDQIVQGINIGKKIM